MRYASREVMLEKNMQGCKHVINLFDSHETSGKLVLLCNTNLDTRRWRWILMYHYEVLYPIVRNKVKGILKLFLFFCPTLQNIVLYLGSTMVPNYDSFSPANAIYQIWIGKYKDWFLIQLLNMLWKMFCEPILLTFW